MSLRPQKLADLGLAADTNTTLIIVAPETEQKAPIAVTEVPVPVVELDVVAIALDDLYIGASAKPKPKKNPKRAHLGYYWQELDKKYWAPDGTGIRCGQCAFFDDGTKPNEPRKDEFNLVGRCRIMDIEDSKVHSQACCNMFRRPRDPGHLHPENEMWPPAYPASCPPAKGKIVLHDCKGRLI